MAQTPFLIKVRAYNMPLVLGGLGFVFVGILAVLIFNTTNWWNLTLVGLGVVSLGFFFVANLAQVREVGKKRSTLVRANLTLMVLAMAGIVCGLNYVVSRHPIRFDLTSNKLYTLADQTMDALKNLKQDVNVTMFVSSKVQPGIQAEVHRAQDLLQEYGKKSSKFKFKVIDMDKFPVEAKKMDVREYNTVVFDTPDNRKFVLQRDYVTYAMSGGRQPVPKFQGEGAFTSALLKLSDTTHITFYLTEGHGEKELGSPQGDGLNVFKEMMEKENYTIKTLNLLTIKDIPEDASVLASVGPTKPFQPNEEKLIEDYLKKGGKLVLCIDPKVKAGLDSIFKDYGIKLGNDFIIDKTSCAYPEMTMVLPQYGNSPIVEKLSREHLATIMPFGRSVQKVDPAIKNVNQSIVMQTTADGWGETDFKDKNPKFHAGIDTKGPVVMGLACELDNAENPSKKTRLVVYGNSFFFTNQFLQGPGNLDVAINSFSWAAEEENKISIHPKQDDMRAMNLSNVGAGFIYYLTVWVMPIAILALGGWVWYRRRSL